MDKDYKSLWEDSINENKALEEENINLANKKYDLELEILNIKNESKSKIASLEEIIDNYRRGIENSNLQLTDYKGKEEKLKTEIANLRQILKAMASLL